MIFFSLFLSVNMKNKMVIMTILDASFLLVSHSVSHLPHLDHTLFSFCLNILRDHQLSSVYLSLLLVDHFLCAHQYTKPCRAIMSLSIATSRLKNIESSMFYDDFTGSPVDHGHPTTHFFIEIDREIVYPSLLHSSCTL